MNPYGIYRLLEEECLRMARTIGALAGSQGVKEPHLIEAQVFLGCSPFLHEKAVGTVTPGSPWRVKRTRRDGLQPHPFKINHLREDIMRTSTVLLQNYKELRDRLPRCPTRPCSCTPEKISNYRKRFAGFLRGHLDMFLRIQCHSAHSMKPAPKATSKSAKTEVSQKRAIQAKRYGME